MNNFLQVMALKEEDMHRVVVVKGREEGGINSIFDPLLGREVFQVFIHSRLPYCTIFSQEFDSFEAARSFAAKTFASDWEFLSWNFKTKRPCEEGGRECGSGECDTCKSIKAEGGTPSGCGHAEAVGSCGLG